MKENRLLRILVSLMLGIFMAAMCCACASNVQEEQNGVEVPSSEEISKDASSLDSDEEIEVVTVDNQYDFDTSDLNSNPEVVDNLPQPNNEDISSDTTTSVEQSAELHKNIKETANDPEQQGVVGAYINNG